MPNIRQLQRFVAVAEERNFRRAAAKLNVSQPPLSDSIKHLEDDIGAPLFIRSRRQVELTKVGEVFLERARLILSQLDDAVNKQVDLFLRCAPGAVANTKDWMITLARNPGKDHQSASAERLADRWEEAEAEEGLSCFLNRTKPSWQND